MSKEFDLDDFDEEAFNPPQQDAGLAQAQALVADMRKSVAALQANAGRVEASLIEFEERAAKRDKAILDRVIDPKDVAGAALHGARLGVEKMHKQLTAQFEALDHNTQKSLERDYEDRRTISDQTQLYLRRLGEAVDRLNASWDNRLDNWHYAMIGALFGIIFGVIISSWIYNESISQAMSEGARYQTAYLLENPDQFKEQLKEYQKQQGADQRKK